MSIILNDDLSDIMGGGARTAPLPTAPEYVRIRETVGEFTERCPKCHGTGQFKSWTGRVFGSCFACKGKGSQSFKTSPEKRADGRETYAQQKEQRLQAFAKAQPEAFAWITREAPRFEFAANMLDAVRTYGELTERQLAAVTKCATRAQTPAAPATPSRATAIDCFKIADAFAAASMAGLKKPKLIVGGYRFSLAPVTGKNAGAIYVTTKAATVPDAFGGVSRQYLGKITDGQLFPVRDTTAEQIAEIVAIAADPANAAKAHGLRTGQCSCCGLPLTNAESIALGIGPICRDKYGF